VCAFAAAFEAEQARVMGWLPYAHVISSAVYGGSSDARETLVEVAIHLLLVFPSFLPSLSRFPFLFALFCFAVVANDASFLYLASSLHCIALHWLSFQVVFDYHLAPPAAPASPPLSAPLVIEHVASLCHFSDNLFLSFLFFLSALRFFFSSCCCLPFPSLSVSLSDVFFLFSP
jgi:hypothetical protein